jgi:hypothetical protein
LFVKRERETERIQKCKVTLCESAKEKEEWVKKGSEDETVTRRTPKKVYDSIVSHTFKVGWIYWFG